MVRLPAMEVFMKKDITIRQHDSKDCGAACLCMVARYYGKKYTIQQLRKITHTSQDGISIWGLAEGADKIGLLAESYKGKINDLKKFAYTERMPLILHLKSNHFVVLYKISKNKLYINDPARGKYNLSWEELDGVWSGCVISFQNTEKEGINAVQNQKYKIIGRLLKANLSLMILISFLSLIIMGITILGAYVFQLLIDYGGVVDEIAEHNNYNFFVEVLCKISHNNIVRLSIILMLMFLVMSIVFVLRGTVISVMSKKIDLSLIDNYVTKIYQSSIRDITSRMSGEYISRIADLVSVRKMISDILVSFTIDIFMITVSIIILIETNIILFILAFSAIMLYIIVVVSMNRPFRNVNYEIMGINAEMQSYFKESLQGIEVIKANNLVEQVKIKFLKKYYKYVNYILKGNILGVISGAIAILVEQISNMMIIFGGFFLISSNSLSLGELLSFYMILSCLITPIKDILSLQPTFQSGVIAVDRIEDIQYMEDEENRGGERLSDLYKIQFQNVSFHYPGKETLIKNVSFEVNGKKKIAIIGKNGSGKSTLIKLLMGIEKAESGRLLINGVEIEKIRLEEIRDKISYVVQDNFLFADTIYNNLTFGKNNYTYEEINDVCKLTGLLEIIEEMPLGYETYINENGDNLSVGQKQLIAITRSILRKPQLLVLDEATSNLDSEREKNVIDNILELPIPCIIITHNQSIINKVDEVVEIE